MSNCVIDFTLCVDVGLTLHINTPLKPNMPSDSEHVPTFSRRFSDWMNLKRLFQFAFFHVRVRLDFFFLEASAPDNNVAKARRGLERHSLQSLSFAWSPPLFHSIFHGQAWLTPLSAGVGNNAAIHAGPVWPPVPRTLTDGITYLSHISLFTQTGKSGFSPGVSPALCTRRLNICVVGIPFMSVSRPCPEGERVLKRMEDQNPGMNLFDFKLPASVVKLRASCKKSHS